MRWAIDGCLSYRRDGLKTPAAVVDASATYFESEDALGKWIEERLKESPQSFTSSSILFSNWQSWAISVGERVGTMKALTTALADRLRSVGWKITQGRDKSGSSRGFYGVTTKGEE